MAENIDLKKIEKKAWMSYFEDGFWDIFFGITFITSAVRSLTDNVWFTLGMLVAVLINIAGKRLITIPRMGRVKFGPRRQKKQLKIGVMILISLLVIFVLGTFMANITFPVMAVWLAVFFGLLAYLMDFSRLFAYGLVFATSEVIWSIYGETYGPIANLIFGVIILLVGLSVLTRFLKKYPKPVEGVSS